MCTSKAAEHWLCRGSCTPTEIWGWCGWCDTMMSSFPIIMSLYIQLFPMRLSILPHVWTHDGCWQVRQWNVKWNQFNWWIFTAFFTVCSPLALPLSNTTGRSSTDWGGEGIRRHIINYDAWTLHYESSSLLHKHTPHASHTIPSLPLILTEGW